MPKTLISGAVLLATGLLSIGHNFLELAKRWLGYGQKLALLSKYGYSQLITWANINIFQ